LKKVIGIAFFIIIVISGYIFYSRVESASQPPRVATLSVKLTKIEESVETRALLFYEESSLVASSAGKLTWLKKHGERVRKGSPVAKVGDRVLYAGSAGILLHNVDEVTGFWRLEEAWAKGDMDLFISKPKEIEDGAMVKPGALIGRISDNIFFYLLVRVKREDFYPKWYDEKRVLLIFPSIGKEKEAKLLRLKSLGNDLLMLLSFTGWDELSGLRYLNVKLVKRRLMGAVIPINAIIIKEGKSGVYLVRGGRVFFKELKFRELGSALALTLDLKEGDRIVVEPDRVSEGSFIRW